MLNKLEKKVLRTIERGREDITKFLRKIVKTPSEMGNEGEVQGLIYEKFHQLGLKVDRWIPTFSDLKENPGFSYPSPRRMFQTEWYNRPNVVGVLEGKFGGRSIILNGHVDVVPTGREREWQHDPWGASLEGDLLYGRGACDMKGGLAGIVAAVEGILQSEVELKGEVILESVIEEETTGNGTLACLMRGYIADAAVIAEPTGLKICPAQNGAQLFAINVKGKASHAVAKTRGVDAIEKMLKIINGFEECDLKDRGLNHPLFKDYAMKDWMMLGMLKAGTWYASIAEEALATGQLRILCGEDPEEIRKRFETHIRMLEKEDNWLKANPSEIEWFGLSGPFEINADHLIIRILGQSFRDIEMLKPEIAGLPASTDAFMFVTHKKIPAVVFGPGDLANAHITDEYIDLKEIVRFAKILAVGIMRWCEIA